MARRQPTRGERHQATAMAEQYADYWRGSYSPWCCLLHYADFRRSHSWHEANPTGETRC